MEIEIIQYKGYSIATVNSNDILISEVQDALDLMGNARYLGAVRIILKKENIVPLFFDLKSKFAGDILQKFSNYNIKLAIVGDFKTLTSQALKDFIYESNKMRFINFVNTLEEAKENLTR